MQEGFLIEINDKEVSLKVKRAVLERIDISTDVSEDEIYEMIDDVINNCEERKTLSFRQRANIRVRIFNEIKRLDIIQELIEDDSVTEIMINGWKDIFIERDGSLSRWDKEFDTPDRLNDIVQRIAAQSNKIINESVPISDTRLDDGSRVNIVMNPIAINGPIITIRKFYDTPMSIDRLIKINSITRECADFLEKLVKAKYNIFISGGTGSGKTTFLNALSNYIPKDERIITIEDSAELKLNDADNLVRLEARNANIEGKNAVSIRHLIKSALRMRPDRIIVGEVRGGEAIDMITAMQTGHDGSLSTGHSNGPEEMMLRLETMILMGMDMPVAAIRNQIASAIDIVVHLGRLRDKSRHVLSISEVLGVKEGEIQLNRLYEFTEEGIDEKNRIKGELKATQNSFIKTEKLQMAGLDF